MNSRPDGVSDRIGAAKSTLDPFILIVDDNQTNRKLALAQLKEFHLAADTANNGLQAVTAIRDKDYKLVLMDCQMPLMDGFEATRTIRTLEAQSGKHTTIVAITAQASATDRAACLAAGMDDYLTKPITSKKLGELLEKWISQEILDGSANIVLAAANSESQPDHFDKFLKMMDAETVKDLQDSFKKDLRSLIDELGVALKDLDLKAVKALAHQLKGTAATFDRLTIATLAKDIEEHAKDADWQGILTLFYELKHQAETFLES